MISYDTGINGIRIEGGRNCVIQNCSILQDVNSPHEHTVGITCIGKHDNTVVRNCVSNRFSLDLGATERDNVTVQFRGDANALNHYSKVMVGPFSPAPVTLAALRPKLGSVIDGRGYWAPGSAVPPPANHSEDETGVIVVNGKKYIIREMDVLFPIDFDGVSGG